MAFMNKTTQINCMISALNWNDYSIVRQNSKFLEALEKLGIKSSNFKGE